MIGRPLAGSQVVGRGCSKTSVENARVVIHQMRVAENGGVAAGKKPADAQPDGTGVRRERVGNLGERTHTSM